MCTPFLCDLPAKKYSSVVKCMSPEPSDGSLLMMMLHRVAMSLSPPMTYSLTACSKPPPPPMRMLMWQYLSSGESNTHIRMPPSP